MNRTVVIAIGAFIIVVSCSLSDDGQIPKPIFTDVETVEISQSDDSMAGSSGEFSYNIPGSATFVFVDLFDGEIVVDDDEKKIDTANLVAGSRTGLEDQGFRRSSVRVKKLLAVKSDKNDFSMNTYYRDTVTGKQTYHWAVIVLDDSLTVTHASPAYEVEIDWDK